MLSCWNGGRFSRPRARRRCAGQKQYGEQPPIDQGIQEEFDAMNAAQGPRHPVSLKQPINPETTNRFKPNVQANRDRDPGQTIKMGKAASRAIRLRRHCTPMTTLRDGICRPKAWPDKISRPSGPPACRRKKYTRGKASQAPTAGPSIARRSERHEFAKTALKNNVSGFATAEQQDNGAGHEQGQKQHGRHDRRCATDGSEDTRLQSYC